MRFLPAVLGALLIGAHFLRRGWVIPALAGAALPSLLLIPRAWATRAVQAGLLLAAAEWIRTGVALARVRMSADQPWGRMALILGAVTALTLVAAAALPGARASRLRTPDRGSGGPI